MNSPHRSRSALGLELVVELDAATVLQVVQLLLEDILAEADGGGGVHLEETAVGVPGKPRVAGGLGETLDGFIVEP